MWYCSMVVRIVHGQALSVYSNRQQEMHAAQNAQRQTEQQQQTSGKQATHNAKTPQEIRSETMTPQGAQVAAQLTQSASFGEAVITSLRSTRNASGTERISDVKEVRQTADNVAKKLKDEPGTGMQAHGDMGGISSTGSVVA